MKLASRFGRVNQIRRDRPLTNDELMAHVPMCIWYQQARIPLGPLHLHSNNHTA